MLQLIEKFFPVTIMAMCFIAAVIYGFNGKWGNCVYWAAAGCLNLSVIFLIPRFG